MTTSGTHIADATLESLAQAIDCRITSCNRAMPDFVEQDILIKVACSP